MLGKKGQISGQVFIYILALIIFSAVLLYGYNAIKKFGQQSEELLITQLTNDIRTEVEKIESQYGSVEKLSVEVPERFDKICFIDTRDGCINRPGDLDCINHDWHVEDYPLICDTWHDCTGENMFLVEGNTVEGFNIGALAVKASPAGERFFCTDVQIPKTSFRLRGTGTYAEISPWEAR